MNHWGLFLQWEPYIGGHISLIEKSKLENPHTLVSIFVNPTQFDNKNDLETYPQTLDADLKMLETARVNYVLCPSASQIYRDDFKFSVNENSFSLTLCGVSRPGHFRGMLTVVMKLLQLARATRAYFGEKDYQQYLLVKQMCEAFFIDTEIVGCETVREVDGLAMSSRNVRLNNMDRERAIQFSKILRESQTVTEAKRRLSDAGFQVDYVEDLFGRRLGAIKVGETRLIDNVQI